MAHVGKNLRAARLRCGLTQDELAEKLSVTRQTVSNYETGRSQPDIDTLLRLAELLHTDVEELLQEGGAPNPGWKPAVWPIFSAAALLCERWVLLPWVTALWEQDYIFWPMVLTAALLEPLLWLWLGWCLAAAALLLRRGKLPQGRWTAWLRRGTWAALAAHLLLMLPAVLGVLGLPIGTYGESASVLLAVTAIMKIRPVFALFGALLRLTKQKKTA